VASGGLSAAADEFVQLRDGSGALGLEPDAGGLQQHQALDGDLALMLRQHQAAQFRTEMAAYAAGQGSGWSCFPASASARMPRAG